MKYFGIFFLVFCTFLGAKEVADVAEGKSLKEAKQIALSGLSTVIQAQVKSNTSIYKAVIDGEYIKKNEQKMEVVSNLPILGVKYYLYPMKKEDKDILSHVNEIINQKKEILPLYKVKAYIDTKNSLPLYINHIDKNTKEINSYAKKDISIYSLKEKTKHYKEMIKKIEDLDRYKVVAYFLGKKSFSELSLSKIDVQNKLEKLKVNVSSIDEAVELIVDSFNIKNKSVKVLYPKYKNHKIPTSFAKNIKKSLQEYLNENDKTYLSHTLKGRYEILQNGDVALRYKLFDRYNKVLKEKEIRISAKGIRGCNLKPQRYCMEFQARDHSFGKKAWKRKLHRSLKGLNLELDSLCDDADKFLVKLKHKKFYSNEVEGEVHLYRFDIRLKDQHKNTLAKYSDEMIYQAEDEDEFEELLEDEEDTDMMFEDIFYKMINK